MKEFFDRVLEVAVDVGFKLLAAIIVLVVGRLVIKWILKVIGKSHFSRKNDPTVIRILQNFVSISLYVLLTVSIIAIFGVPMASIIAVIASAGVAIGLALQGSLSNLAGGIMILIFRPFRIGDFVEADGHTGTISDIGIFYTFITTPDNKVITVPNGTVMNNAVVNFSTKDQRRVDFSFGVAYGTDVDKVNGILLEAAQQHELVLKDPAPFARLSQQSASSLEFTLRVWTENADYWQVHFDLLETIHKRFVEEGIEIPFDQLDVHIKDGNAPKSKQD